MFVFCQVVFEDEIEPAYHPPPQVNIAAISLNNCCLY